MRFRQDVSYMRYPISSKLRPDSVFELDEQKIQNLKPLHPMLKAELTVKVVNSAYIMMHKTKLLLLVENTKENSIIF